jgi:hypothetical protein
VEGSGLVCEEGVSIVQMTAFGHTMCLQVFLFQSF